MVSAAQLAADAEVVLLDGMGTLVELKPPWSALANELRAGHGVAVAEVEAERAMRAEMAFYKRHHHEGRDQASLERLRLRCAEALHCALPSSAREAIAPEAVCGAMLRSLSFAAYPDAGPALAGLRAMGKRALVVSNWDISLAGVLDRTGLAGMLDGVLTSAEVSRPKPDPAIFRAALELAGVEPCQALHVGDSPENDLAGARAAGIPAVLIRRTSPDGTSVDGSPADAPSADAPSVDGLSADVPSADVPPSTLRAPAGVPVISTLTELLG